MNDILSANSAWIYFVIAFVGIIAYIAVMQRVESSRIMKKYSQGAVLFMSFGVNYFGLESEPGGRVDVKKPSAQRVA